MASSHLAVSLLAGSVALVGKARMIAGLDWLVFVLIQNSAALSIDLNAKDRSNGWTAFHVACYNGNSKVAKILMQNSNEFKIDINGRSKFNSTAFHFACQSGDTKLVDMIIDNAKSYNLNLTAKDDFGDTGFQYAFDVDVINLIKMKLPSTTL